MRQTRPRWAVSFADLCLLMLGFMIILQARPDGTALASGLRSAMAGDGARVEQPAASLFEPGEAVLTVRGRRFVDDYARETGAHRLRLTSHGTDARSARFDGWELSAARLAAVARALEASHIGADRIALSIDGASGGGQTIAIERN